MAILSNHMQLWREIDACDCMVSGIAAYRIVDTNGRRFVRDKPRGECALTFVRDSGYHYIRSDGTEFDCMPGEMTFLPRGSMYRHEPLTIPSRMDVVYFTLWRSDGTLFGFEQPEILHLRCAEPERMSRLFSELCTKFFGVMTPRAEVKAVLLRILGTLAREESSGNLTETELAMLTPALEHIAAADGDVRVRELAACCHLSEYAFRELFKKYAGMPPKAFLLERRIANVEALYAVSDITLTDAARICGFEDPAYFFKVYRRLHGHAPGKMD